MHGVLKLRKMVQDDPDMGWRERYDARGTEEIVARWSRARSTGTHLGRHAGA